jgi:hypothetical protein
MAAELMQVAHPADHIFQHAFAHRLLEGELGDMQSCHLAEMKTVYGQSDRQWE